MSSGTATILLFVPIAAWAIVTQLWLVSICHRKGKHALARTGLVGLVVPGLFVAPLIGASRLARPSSLWAALHYGDEFMGRAARRYPDDHDSALGFSMPRRRRTMWEKLIVAGLIATAVFLMALFGRTNYTGYASMLMLLQVTAITWLAEVELTARPYAARSVPETAPGAPVPMPH